VADVDFRNVYERRGYLQVQFGPPTPTAPDSVKPTLRQRTILSRVAPDANLVHVDVHLPVQPGIQFHLLSVDWTGNHASRRTSLQKFVTTQPGAIAELPRLRERCWTKLTKAYRSPSSAIWPCNTHWSRIWTQQPRQSPSQSRLVEGDVYHFGELPSKASTRKPRPPARALDAASGRTLRRQLIEMTFMKETQNLLRQGRWSSATYFGRVRQERRRGPPVLRDIYQLALKRCSLFGYHILQVTLSLFEGMHSLRTAGASRGPDGFGRRSYLIPAGRFARASFAAGTIPQSDLKRD